VPLEEWRHLLTSRDSVHLSKASTSQRSAALPVNQRRTARTSALTPTNSERPFVISWNSTGPVFLAASLRVGYLNGEVATPDTHDLRTSSRGCYEDATRKTTRWNSSLSAEAKAREQKRRRECYVSGVRNIPHAFHRAQSTVNHRYFSSCFSTV